MAKCCQPAPPDAIIGYVTAAHGVTIHRQDCAFIQRLPEDRLSRVLAAQWGSGGGMPFTVDIEVEAHDRQGLLRDISDLFAREEINVVRVNTLSRQFKARMRFSVELKDIQHLDRLFLLIRQVSDVIAVRRV
jgi:GTP pyrophosphokinase